MSSPQIHSLKTRLSKFNNHKHTQPLSPTTIELIVHPCLPCVLLTSTICHRCVYLSPCVILETTPPVQTKIFPRCGCLSLTMEGQINTGSGRDWASKGERLSGKGSEREEESEKQKRLFPAVMAARCSDSLCDVKAAFQTCSYFKEADHYLERFCFLKAKLDIFSFSSLVVCLVSKPFFSYTLPFSLCFLYPK